MGKLRYCKGCNKDLDINSFNKKLKGFQSLCKQCSKSWLKDYRTNYPERQILACVKQRCENTNCKDYKDYGLRGIKCLITKEEIRKLMERDGYWNLKQPTINRKDNDDNYTLNNCEFIENKDNVAERNKRRKIKSVLQFDLQGNFIREWESIKMAASFIGIKSAGICAMLKKRRPTAGGFKWSYNERI